VSWSTLGHPVAYMKAGFTVSTMNIICFILIQSDITIREISLFNHEYKLASIQTLSSLKTGTPPLRGELTVLPQGGVHLFQGGSTPPLWGGWINPCILCHWKLYWHCRET